MRTRPPRTKEDKELGDWLKQNLGRRRYWFWTVAAKVLPTSALVWLLNRVPDE